MANSLDEIVEHQPDDECPVCRAQDFVDAALIPAVSAWELTSDLPRFAMALHGAAGLLAAMLAEGVARDDIETALGRLLDDLELQINEENMMGGPTQGSA